MNEVRNQSRAPSVSPRSEWQQAALAVLAWNYLGADDEYFVDHISWIPDIWWLQPRTSKTEWLIGIDALSQKGLQWDGLGQLIWISLHDYTNPFLHCSTAEYIDEYIMDPFRWTVADVQFLAEQWQQEARPIVERIKQFRTWFNNHPVATTAHLEVLEMLEEVSEETI